MIFIFGLLGWRVGLACCMGGQAGELPNNIKKKTQNKAWGEAAVDLRPTSIAPNYTNSMGLDDEPIPQASKLHHDEGTMMTFRELRDPDRGSQHIEGRDCIVYPRRPR